MVQVHVHPRLKSIGGAIIATLVAFYLLAEQGRLLPHGHSNVAGRVSNVVLIPLLIIWAHTFSGLFGIGTLGDSPLGKVVRSAAWAFMILGGLATVKLLGA